VKFGVIVELGMGPGRERPVGETDREQHESDAADAATRKGRALGRASEDIGGSGDLRAQD